MPKQKNTQTTYTVLAVIPLADGELGEMDGGTFRTMAAAEADARRCGGLSMIRENRVVWLSPDLEVKLLARKIIRNSALPHEPIKGDEGRGS